MLGLAALVFVSFFFVSPVNTADILVVAPTHALSHFKMIQPLLKYLSQTGHRLTVLSFYPSGANNPNHTDIDLRPVLSPYNVNCEHWSLLFDIADLFNYGTASCDTLLGSDPVQGLLRSNNKFDLVLIEGFACDAVLGFPLFYNAPYIVFSPMALPPWLAEWSWNPIESSYVPDHMCRESASNMFSRVYRLGCQTVIRGVNWLMNTLPSIKLIKKHFDIELYSLDDIKSNMSAMFVNTIPTLGGVRPYLPNIVEVGGIHLEPLQDLPQELADWLDGCTAGAVVFSMGSMVRAATLDSHIRDQLVAILGRLQECVLWKWEENIADLPTNIKTVDWLPQSHVLAHKNVKVFISHGGFHGLFEAIYRGVPVLGIPLYGDQMTNLRMLELEGAAIVVSLKHFLPLHFEQSLHKLLEDHSYKSHMMKLSAISRDSAQLPLERAVWWTEYVLRHHGAPHFRHKGVQMKWWEYYMMDAILFCIAALVLIHFCCT